MSENEKNFDELLNDKCSWSYKTFKSITFGEKMESNSTLQLPNADESRKSLENEDDSFVIPATFDLNELENSKDENESEKSVLNCEIEVNAEMLIGHDPMPGSQIDSKKNKVMSCKNKSVRRIDKYDANIKKSFRKTERKSYVESDVESNTYSSSDEEVVLQTRICNEEGKPISNVPEENSCHTGELMESPNNKTDNFNKFCNDNSDNSNLGNEQPDSFNSSSSKEVNTIIPVKDSNKNINFPNLDQKDAICLDRSFSEKRNLKSKFGVETSSFELSSLIEAGDANEEMFKDICTTSSNNPGETNLQSEIILKCLDISSEVHSLCDDIETSEVSTLNVIVNDFFSGTLDVNKYEINKRNPKNVAILKEIYETEHDGKKNENKILSNQENCLPIPETQDSVVQVTDSDDDQVLANINKSVKSKALEMKQISKKDLKTIKKKTPQAIRSTKNSLNEQKNKKHGTNGTQKKNEDPLLDRFNRKLSHLKQNDNNYSAIKSTSEAVIDKYLNKTTNKMKQGNCQPLKVLESFIMEDEKAEDLSYRPLCKNILFEVDEVETQEKKIEKDYKKVISQRTAKEERKSGNISLNSKNNLFTDEFELMQQRRVTSKRLNNYSPFKNTPVKHLPNEVSRDFNKDNKIWKSNKEVIKNENTRPRHIAKNGNFKKHPKNWNDMEKLFSNEINYDSDTLQVCCERPTTFKNVLVTDENTVNAVNIYGIINKQNKKARINTDVANEYSVISNPIRNKYNMVLKNNFDISPKTAPKRYNELELISPNANMINKVMKNMEECTLPYLTSSQERQRASFNDSKSSNGCSKSPIVTEYSYSIKEIQSTILFTAGKTNSAKQVTNIVQSDDTKTRLCKFSQKSILNKNYKVQKQEKKFKTLSMRKDRCDDQPSVPMKSDAPRLIQKEWFDKNIESKGNASKENTKQNVLNNILARLEVEDNSHDRQKNNYVDNKTKLPNRKNINKKIPNLETSISTMESNSLSPGQVEQGHYNLRKRKRKGYKEDFDNNPSNKKNLDFYEQNGNVKSRTNHNGTKAKRNMNWNGENDNTDSSCEIIDTPKQKRNQMKLLQNGKQIKAGETKNVDSKSRDSPTPLHKKKTEFCKQVRNQFKDPFSSCDGSNDDSEGSIYECRDLNTRGVTNKSHTIVTPNIHWKEHNSDCSYEIFDFAKQSSSIQQKENPNRNLSNITKVKDLKSHSNKYPSLNKKKIKEFDKTEILLPKSKCQKSLNTNGKANIDSEDELVEIIDKSKNMFKRDNELFSKTNRSNCSKIPQMGMKITTNKNRHLYTGKEQIHRHDFSQEQTKLTSNLQTSSSSKQNLEKSRKVDSYKKYLETIFKDTNQKTSKHRNTLSIIQEQKCRESTLIEDSEKYDELFSLSSSDSEDYQKPECKTDLGLFDALYRPNGSEEE